jgi:hypothetical protein
MEIWELVARESARDLVARYNACGDADEIDAMVDLFARDAVIDVGEWGCHAGRDAIRAFFEGVRRPVSEKPEAQTRFIRHFTATHRIDVERAGRARGQCYFLVLTRDGLDHWGRYLDEYTVEDGAWRFAHRSVVVEGMTPGGFAAARHARLGRGAPEAEATIEAKS